MTRLRRPQLALIALLVALLVGYTINAARSHSHSTPSRPSVSSSAPSPSATAGSSPASLTPLSSLPAQATATVQLIQHHGPYPYSQDGVVFDNNERHLPSHARGYYHEYTVTTPGSADRGARRIITGSTGEYYYTADHYDSFVGVDVTR